LKILFNISIRNGIIAGLLASALLIAMFYMGVHPLLISPFMDFRIFLFGVFIFFALKEFRNYYQQGLLYFWQGLIGGFFVVFFTTLLAAAGLWIFGTVEPEFVKRYIEEFTLYLKTFSEEDIGRIGKSVYERNLEWLPSTHIADLVQTYFVQGMIIGFFVSIILSVVLRRTT
jgi:hypothetical protein